jgi:DNA invertase Pin-like site-specific DNA recombinase
VLQTLQHLQRLTDQGVGFRSYTESYPDSCEVFKDAVISILAVIAKQERMRTRERVLAGIERYRNEFGRGIIGKEKSSRSGKHQAIGRPQRIFDKHEVFRLKAEGLSLRQIASKLGVGLGTNSGIEVRSKN